MLFLKAWLIGVAIAAPVGPIGLLCIKKTLEVGFKEGLSVGLGAALADGVYGLIAALGLTALTTILLENSVYLKLFGGLMLLYLAYKGLSIKQNNTEIKTKTGYLAIQVFFLTLANPITILSFLAVFSSIDCGTTSITEASIMTLGVFLGSLSWWIFLCTLLQSIRHKIPNSWLKGISYLSASILALFGGFSLLGCAP